MKRGVMAAINQTVDYDDGGAGGRGAGPPQAEEAQTAPATADAVEGEAEEAPEDQARRSSRGRRS